MQSVSVGEQLTSEAGSAVEEIRKLAHQVADLVEEIASGLREQSAASTDVASRVEKIAVQAEELSSCNHSTLTAAHSLERIAKDMLGAVNQFRLD